jgi:hypothetical protein
MQKRTVAILDILGFKEMIETTPIDDLSKKFARVVDGVLNKINRQLIQAPSEPSLFGDFGDEKSWCLSFHFSDTIVLISHDDSETSCLKLLVYLRTVTQFLLSSKYPSRGAVSFGEMFVDVDRRMFLGKALTDAHNLEKRQDWIGCAISNSIEVAFPNIFKKSDVLEKVFPVYQIPMKDGPVQNMRTVNWRWGLVVQGGTKSLFPNIDKWPEKRKIDNTLQFAKSMRITDCAFAPNDSLIPLEVRTMFVGNGPPPPNFQHGDDY